MLEVDTKPVESGADHINSILTTKGYTEEPLKFVSIDWESLIEDQPHRAELSKLIVGDQLFNNDKNIINILYSLTRAIERHNDQQRALREGLVSKDSKIDELQNEIASLKSKNSTLEQRIGGLLQVEKHTLNEKIKSLHRVNRSQNIELQKLKKSTADIENKYDVEIRKKNIELSQLKDRLLDSRNLSAYSIYDRDFDSNSLDSNSHTIHNNKPIADNAALNEESDTKVALNAEYDNVTNKLSELSENLIQENIKYANFVNELNTYFDRLNNQLSLLNYKALKKDPLVNPSSEIDLARILQASRRDIEPFDHVSSPLLSNIYKNNHYVSALVEVALSSSGGNLSGLDGDEINRLKAENKQLYENLDEAVKALEQWQKFLPAKSRSRS